MVSPYSMDVDGVRTDDLIENNGAKRYRFSVPPQNITIDAPAVEQHFPEGAAFLRSAGLITDECVGTRPSRP